jgi:hypothetical protein
MRRAVAIGAVTVMWSSSFVCQICILSDCEHIGPPGHAAGIVWEAGAEHFHTPVLPHSAAFTALSGT